MMYYKYINLIIDCLIYGPHNINKINTQRNKKGIKLMENL